MRLLRIALAATVLAAAVALGLALSLPGLVGWALERRLAALAGAPAKVTVADLGRTGLHLSAVEIGTEARLSDVVLAWRPEELFRGRIDALSVGSARLTAALTRGGLRLGPADALLRADTGPFVVGRVTIDNTEVDLALPTGRLALSLRASREDGRLAGEIAAPGVGAADFVLSGGSLSLVGRQPWRVTVPAVAGLAERTVELAGLDGGGPRFAWNGTMLDAALRIAESGVAAQLEGSVRLGNDGSPQRFAIRRLDVEARGLVTPYARIDATVRMADLAGDLSNAAGVARIGLEVRDFAYRQTRIAQANLELTGTVHYAGGRAVFTVDAPGRLSLSPAKLGNFVALPVASEAAVVPGPGATVEFVPTPRGVAVRPNLPSRAKLPLSIGTLALKAEVPEIVVTGSLDLPHGPFLPALTFAHAMIEVPAWDWKAVEADGSIAETMPETAVQLTLPRLGPGDMPLSGELALVPQSDGGMTLDARIAGPGVDVGLAGRHDPVTGRGAASIGGGSLRFDPSGLQPRQLAPGAADWLAEADGAISVNGAISWAPGRFLPDLKLVVEDLNGRIGGVRLRKVNAAIRLDGLAPASTPPGQAMAIGLLQAGLPLTDAQMSFRLDRGRLLVERAAARLAGGTVTMADAMFDPAAKRRRLALRVEGLDVARLVEMMDVDGLSATGTLRGTVPLVMTDGLTIDGARLTAAGKGVVRYRPSDPAKVKSLGESMELLLKALDDFHYEELHMTLNGKAGGDLVATMQITGRNPNLYSGYPIEFNLNVSGKLDSILDEARISDQIPAMLRQRMQQYRTQ